MKHISSYQTFVFLSLTHTHTHTINHTLQWDIYSGNLRRCADVITEHTYCLGDKIHRKRQLNQHTSGHGSWTTICVHKSMTIFQIVTSWFYIMRGNGCHSFQWLFMPLPCVCYFKICTLPSGHVSLHLQSFKLRHLQSFVFGMWHYRISHSLVQWAVFSIPCAELNIHLSYFSSSAVGTVYSTWWH